MPKFSTLATVFLAGALLTGCGSPAPDLLAANKALVTRFAALVGSAQFDQIDELLLPGFVRHSQATPGVTVRSAADFKKFLLENHAIFPDERMEMLRLVAEGDSVAFWGRYTATQTAPMGPFPASGKKMTLDTSGLFRIEDGKLAELWITWDNAAALEQLGHALPPPVPQP